MKNPRHEMFLREYLDPNSEVFGNAAGSYALVYGVDPKVAAVSACKLLKREDIREEIDRTLEQAEMSRSQRVQLLSEIAKGIGQRKTVTKRRRMVEGEDGVMHEELVIDTVVERDVSCQDQEKAVDLLNKLSGDYTEAKTVKKRDLFEIPAARELYRELMGTEPPTVTAESLPKKSIVSSPGRTEEMSTNTPGDQSGGEEE